MAKKEPEVKVEGAVPEDDEGEVEHVDAAGNAATPAAPARTKVMIWVGQRFTNIALEDEGCDPVIHAIGPVVLEEALAQVPHLLYQARALWRQKPKNDAYKRPTPPPAKAVAKPAARAAPPPKAAVKGKPVEKVTQKSLM